MRLASEGARVACVSRTEESARKITDEINGLRGESAKAYAIDVADHAAVQKFAAQILEDSGRTDILVNNAGVTRDALAMLRGWDGSMDADSAAATVYAAFRARLVRDVLQPLLGPLAGDAFATVAGAPTGHIVRLRGRVTGWIREDDRTLLGPSDDWASVMARAPLVILASGGTDAPTISSSLLGRPDRMTIVCGSSFRFVATTCPRTV